MPRRRARLARAARTATVADAVLALARDQLAGRLPGARQRRRPRAKLLLLGAAAAAVAAAATLQRGRIAAALPSRGSEPQDDLTEAPPGEAPIPGPSVAAAEQRAAEAAARADLAADEAERLRAPAREDLPGGGISGRGRDDRSPDPSGPGA